MSPIVAEAASLPRTVALAEFFQRLGPLEPLVRIALGEAPVSVDLTFRGKPETRILLDYTRVPGRIVAGPSQPGRIRVTIDAEVMHRILMGELHPGEAFGQRHLLLRGSAADLARVIPLFDLAPLIYREHLSAQALASSDRGSSRTSASEVIMAEDDRKSTLSVMRRLAPGSERAAATLLRRAAYGLGYGMAALRQRLWRKLNLLELLTAMSQGVAAATPPSAEAGEEP